MRLRPPGTSRVMSFDMTPMIDVVLQLIIFFMFTSQFGELTRSDVRLPTEAGEESKQPTPPALVLDINSAGGFVMERREISVDELRLLASAAVARAAEGSTPVALIRADQAADASDLDRALAALRDGGITRWRLGTMRDQGAGVTSP